MKNIKLGIIGGGQLGSLLVQKAIEFPIDIAVYDPNSECPAVNFVKEFQQGEFHDKESIIAFGMKCDVIIFEIEKVNVEALLELQKNGKKVISNPENLAWIQDKGLQRKKFEAAGFPIPQYEIFSGENITNYQGSFPIVQKWCQGGYDGQGVSILKSKEDLENAKKVNSVFEEKIAIKKEISMIVARNEKGENAVYPPIEMVFDPEAHLIDHLVAPADINQSIADELHALTIEIAEKLNFIGIYAIEFFIDENDKIFINEVAPRTHNSGHHTTIANMTSQYEQQIRIVLGLPLGSVKTLSPCVLVNLVGKGESGITHYEGLEEAYGIPNIQLHLYGKKEVRPNRKMGHAVILESSIEEALKKADTLKNTLNIIRYEK